MEEFYDGFLFLFWIFKIPLRNYKGKIIAHALVSEEDFERVILIRWHFTAGYANNDSHGYLHRFVFDFIPEGLEIDHVNQVKLDNRRENLRIATHSENNQNRPKKEGTTSRFRGVSWHKNNKWVVQLGLSVDGETKNKYLGCFDDEEAAAQRWDKAVIKSGTMDFRQLNFEYFHEQIQEILSSEDEPEKKHSSEYHGVCWYKLRNDWCASIYIGKKRKHLGYFTDEEDAARRHDKEAIKIGRSSDRLNFEYTDEETEIILAEE